MLADFRLCQIVRSYYGPFFPASAPAANPLRLNSLPVSTFTSKILHSASQLRTNEFKDLACPTVPPAAKTVQFPQLSPTLSIFYPQLLWIQRFCPCLPAKLMIPQDAGEGVYTSMPRSPKRVPITHLFSIFCQQLLWIQRFCSCSPANIMIPKDRRRRVYPRLAGQQIAVEREAQCDDLTFASDSPHPCRFEFLAVAPKS